MIDGSLGKDSVMEAVSTISNFVITGYGVLGWYFVIYGILGKDSVIEALSTIINFFFLSSSFGLASEVPKLTHYGVVLFHPRA